MESSGHISSANLAPAGANLTAGGRTFVPLAVYPDNPSGVDAVGLHASLDVVFFGHDGALYDATAFGLDSWQPPRRVTNVGLAPPGAGVASNHQTSNQLDVFFIDNNGILNVAWAVDGQGQSWNGPVGISSPVAPPGAKVVAVKQADSPGQLDVFFIDNRGTLNVSWTGPQHWEGPIGFSPPNIAPPGGGLVSTLQGSQLDVFFVDNNGALNVSWNTPQRWEGPVGITPPGFAPPGTTPASAYQQAGQLDVFVNGSERWVSWTGPERWEGPYAMPN
jgi:hypothetical protein